MADQCCLQLYSEGGGQAPTLSVTETMKGSNPPFDEGSLGIYTLPLGSEVIDLVPEIQTITVQASATDVFAPSGYFYVSFESHSSQPILPTASVCILVQYRRSLFLPFRIP